MESEFLCTKKQKSEVKVLLAQSYPTLCNPMDWGPLGSLSMGFFRQEYWSGYTFPSLGDLFKPETEPESPELQADSSLSEPPGKPENQKSS